ncbi:MAG: PQQ-binding-like beta-propeller repeat protein [Planctomycetes bacterium]|nr:PQQ-binding-like beta-propeller repeat protein [Planctomycetota bacterium]MBI3846937.1 PQQ-binding-like beta-propeller repeat protein [Planctomycetota bacterium]
MSTSIHAALVVIALSGPSAAAGDDPAAREWNQARGNAARTAASPVAPIRVEPEVAWRVKLPGDLLCEPVTWGGVLYVAVAKPSGRELHAFDGTTGKPTSTPRLLGKGGPIELVTWEGVVVACEPNLVRGFVRNAAGLGSAWERKMAGLGRPCVYDGKIYFEADRHLVCIDAKSGNVVSATTTFHSLGLLAIAPREFGGKPLVTGITLDKPANVRSEVAVLVQIPVDAVSSPPSNPKSAPPVVDRRQVAPIAAGNRAASREFTVAQLCGGEKNEISWWISSPLLFPGEKADFPSCIAPEPSVRNAGRFEVAFPAAIHDDVAYGFDGTGEILACRSTGSTRPFSFAKLPAGAKPGPATMASDVLYFGNWALDTKRSRILWCHPDDTPATSAIPVGDCRLVFATGSGELVCLAEPAESPTPK